MRWFVKATRGQAHSKRASATAPTEPAGVHAILHALPTLLDSSGLPDGVVELLIEDFETPTRQLFDIHDGHLTRAEPGKCVPWACIAGPVNAWALALGPARNTAGLQLTGDKQLARRVLAALPHASKTRVGPD